MEQKSTPNKRARIHMRRRAVLAVRNHHQPEQLKLNMEIKEDALSTVAVLEVLDKNNYVAWSVRVKTYLMAQDLWEVVEATTEPPKQEDDEAAFKAWSKKNFMALHVLKDSCGLHALSVIKQISSAKIAWNTLTVVLQVLEKDNYVDWSVRVKTYLMAHDLWDIIEGTTEPPNKEDDEAVFKAWSKKNSKALHVIQISCGPDTFSEIIQINSPKIAWDTLAEKFLQVLEEDNYADWSLRVKNYLMAHDLWDIIEGTTEPPKQEDDEAVFMAWSHKNSMALHEIQISCRPNIFSEIIKMGSAKIAWDTLAEKYNIPTNTNSGSDRNEDYVQYEALIKAVKIGEWNAVEEFLNLKPDAAGAKITSSGATALFIAVCAQHEHIVENLVDIMSVEDLAIQDCYGNTALSTAIDGIQYRMIECILRKNKHLLSIKDCSSYIPVTQAITRGHIKLACYLYPLTPLEDLMPERGSHGATLCVQAIRARKFDIALELIQLCPRLALALENEGCSPLYALASMPCAFPRGNRLVFWKRWIYSCIRIQSACATEEFRLNIQNGEERQSDQVKVKKSVLALLRQLVTNVLNLLGIKELYEMKFLHVQSRELLQCMCKEISSSNIEQMEKGLVYDTIFQAIKKDIFEFVCDIVRANPDLLRTCTDEYNRDIFSVAVLHRQAKIFSLIYGLDNEKNDLTFVRDMYGDEILQMTGMLATSTQLNRIPGAALQMQRELQWYKEVESIVFPKVLETLNKDRLKPRELFTKNHKELMKEGEKWMKDTATSCTVVGALIVTIMFAAAFAVPSGNEDIMFFNEKLVMLFIVSDSLSFFSSATSILMFLGILTSRYAEEDFLKSLPTKMIIGLSTLFLSIASMMIAFCVALELMLGRQRSWFFNPVICLASVPVTLFVVMQFPLLVDMFISTYGSGIFDRKMKHWF